MAGSAHAEENKDRGGRFLFAGDDDWDWATPLGAKEPSKLVRYGAMSWSALDWAEEGLDEVRGGLIGIPPNAKKTMTMDDLSKLRGAKATYQHHPQGPGIVQRLLAEKEPPNVIILMQNSSIGAGAPDDATIKTLVAFVKSGGRLVVLDEWKRYRSVLQAVTSSALTLPPGAPIPIAPPAVRPKPKPKPNPEAKQDAQPDDKEKSPPKKKTEEASDKELKLKARLADLVPQLGDETFKVRAQASEDILELGVEALPLLLEMKSDDPEVASRLAHLRDQLTPKVNRAPRRPVMTPAQQAAVRTAKRQENATLVKDAARKLSAKNLSHQLSEVLVDGDKQILPVLRISFPAPQ